MTTGKELALDIRFTAPEPTDGYFDVVDPIPGDSNCDGVIDVRDLVHLKKNPVSGTGKLATDDFNSDGRITSYDLVLLRRYLMYAEGLEANELPFVPSV